MVTFVQAAVFLSPIWGRKLRRLWLIGVRVPWQGVPRLGSMPGCHCPNQLNLIKSTCFSMRLSYAMYPVHTQSDVSIHGRFYHAALASRFPRRTPSLDKLPNGKFHKPLCRFYRNWQHRWANSLTSWWTYHVPSTCLKSTMGNDSIGLPLRGGITARK